MYIRGKFEKTGYIKFIGHLDLVGLMEKAFKRAGMDLAYTEGFNPQPDLSIVNPLPLGVESTCEYVQFKLKTPMDLDLMLDLANKEMPRGLKFLKFDEGPRLKLQKIIKYMVYRLDFDYPVKAMDLERRMEDFLALDSYIVYRPKKRKKRTINIPVDIRPFLVDYEIGENFLQYKTKASLGGNLKAEDLANFINEEEIILDLDQTYIRRISQRNIKDREII